MQCPLCCRLDGHKLQHPWVHLPAVAMLMTTFKRDSTTCENNSIVCMGFVGGAVHLVVFVDKWQRAGAAIFGVVPCTAICSIWVSLVQHHVLSC